MLSRIKLLPITIAVALVLLAVKVGDVWQGADAVLQSALAQDAESMEDGDEAIDTPESSPDAGPPSLSLDTMDQSALSTFDPVDITPEDIELLESLTKRREQLEARDREIDLREKLLAAAEDRVDAKVEELKELQETVESLIAKLDGEQEDKIKSLVKIYEQMRPKDAARIFDELDMAVLLDVIDRMREAKAAAIMGKMDSDKAKSLTILLAERREVSEGDKKFTDIGPQ